MTMINSGYKFASMIMLVGILFVLPAHASDQANASQEKEAATRLEVDKAQNVVRIIIDGKEVAFFDKDGLNIKGDIKHTGLLKNEQPHEE
jgi:hypothetical protein